MDNDSDDDRLQTADHTMVNGAELEEVRHIFTDQTIKAPFFLTLFGAHTL